MRAPPGLHLAKCASGARRPWSTEVGPVHVRPAVGVGRVLDGTFESAFGDDPVVEVHAGEGLGSPSHAESEIPDVDHEAPTLEAGAGPRMLDTHPELFVGESFALLGSAPPALAP